MRGDEKDHGEQQEGSGTLRQAVSREQKSGAQVHRVSDVAVGAGGDEIPRRIEGRDVPAAAQDEHSQTGEDEEAPADATAHPTGASPFGKESPKRSSHARTAEASQPRRKTIPAA